jgi:hypothetical protein
VQWRNATICLIGLLQLRGPKMAALAHEDCSASRLSCSPNEFNQQR